MAMRGVMLTCMNLVDVVTSTLSVSYMGSSRQYSKIWTVGFPLAITKGKKKKKTKEETNNLTATSPAMFLINRHATRYAEKNRPPSKDFHDSFALFIKSYKEYEFPIEYRNDGHPLNTYHLNFLKNC